MTRSEIEGKVRRLLLEDLEIDEKRIYNDARLKEDIGIDSLDFLDVVVLAEHYFGFKIKPEEMKNVITLEQFCDYVESKVN